MSGPLAGIKVIGLTTWAAMPAACVILGDWGAEVIKIEHPAGGDPSRAWSAEARGLPPCPLNPLWEQDNRNQKGVAIDLSRERGREIAYKLVENSDVFASNLQEPSLKRIAMDYDTLRQVNSRLIYAHLSGFGAKGPDWAKPGFDHTAFWASSGIMASLGEPDQPPPGQRVAIGDHITSLAIAAGIVAALFARERQGLGQRVDTCLMATGLWVNSIQIQASLLSGQEVPRASRASELNPLHNVYRCKDGHWIQLAVLQPDRFWSSFCRALGMEHLEGDLRFDTSERRARNCRELISILDGVIASRDLEEWGRSFDEWGLVWAPVNTVKDAAGDPQTVANRFVVPLEHPALGAMKTVSSPWGFSETPPAVRSPSPTLGQHTEEVLLRIGYTREDITGLKEEGVIL